MHSLLGPQYDAEIAYRQERIRTEFARSRRQRTGLSRLIARHRRLPDSVLTTPSR